MAMEKSTKQTVPVFGGHSLSRGEHRVTGALHNCLLAFRSGPAPGRLLRQCGRGLERVSRHHFLAQSFLLEAGLG